MKKLSLLLAAIMIITLLPIVSHAAGHDAYVGMKGVERDECTVNVEVAGDMIHSLSLASGARVVYKNVDFGSTGAFRADIKIGAHLDTPTYMGGTVEMRLDGVGGDVIAKFKTDTTTPRFHSYELLEPITGVHDVYLIFTTRQPMKLEALVFQEYAKDGNEFAAYNEPDYLKDIQNTGKKDLIYTLIELGFVEPFTRDEYNPYIGIIRGDYAVTIAKILGYDGKGQADTGFTDIDPKSEYAGAVAFLQQKGVIKGHGNGEYHPETYITVNEALTMAVRALGYEPMVIAKGEGYPNGYLNMAVSLGLTKNVASGDKLTRGDLANLVDNILNAQFIETVGLEGDYDIVSRDTGILTKTLKINKSRGTVTANSFTTLAAPIESIGEKKVVISGEEYNIGKTYGASLIGYDINFYYIEENDEKTLLSVSPTSSMTITAVDTAEGDKVTQLSEKKIEYYDYDEDEFKTINFSSDMHILYNGKAIDDTLSNMISNDFRGRVRLVESASETTLIIEEYVSVWAEKVQTSRYKVYDGISKTNIVFDTKADHVAVFNKGKAVLFKTLNDNMILDIYESKNKTGKKLIRINTCVNTVEGTINAVNGNDVTIRETVYKTSKQANQSFYPGLNAEFLLNEKGEIVAYFEIEKTKDFKVGLLSDFENDITIDTTAKLNIFDDTNSFTEYKCANGIVIDGVKIRDAGKVISGNDTFAGLANMDIKNTLVRYAVNDAGEVTILDTYLTGAGGSNDTFTRLTEPRTTFQYNGTSKLFVYASGSRSIAPYQASPAIFGFEEANQKDTLVYSSTLGDYYDSSTVRDMTGELYCLDKEEPYVSHVKLDSITNPTSSSGSPFIIDKISIGYKDKEEALVITGKRNTTSLEFFIKKSELEDVGSDANRIKTRDILKYASPGDVIAVKASKDGEISKCDNLVFLANGAEISPGGIDPLMDKVNGLGALGSVSRWNARLFGEVVDVLDGFIKIEYATGEYEYINNSTKCMRFTKSGNKTTLENKLDPKEISVGDKVLYLTENANASIMCIYDNPQLQ